MTCVAVIPVHDAPSDFLDRLAVVQRQVALVVIVDDGSETPLLVDEHLLPGVVVIRQHNLGIAAALNTGITRARALVPAVETYLTLDQDSLISPNYVNAATSELRIAESSGGRVGAICAEQFNDWQPSFTVAPDGSRHVLAVAQSGMLIPDHVLQEFGPFREDLFIDCVDTEFVLRLAREGVPVIAGRGCRMEHEVGETILLTVFGRPLKVGGRRRSLPHHSAVRRYFITRNRLLIYPSFASTAPAWLFKDSLREVRTLVLSLLFGPEKGLQARATLAGLVDGLAGRSGPLSERRSRQLISSARG